MANIVITTHWTGGDVYPFIRIGRRLLRRGHAVTVVTHAYYEPHVRQAGLAFAPIDTLDDWETILHVNGPQAVQMLDNLQSVTDQLEAHADDPDRIFEIKQIQREYEALRPLCLADDTVLVARHGSSTTAMLLAEALRLPVVAVYMAPAMVLQPLLAESMIGPLMRDDLNRLRELFDLPPVSSWRRWVDGARRSIGLWPAWFAEPEPQWPVNPLPVGFPLENSRTTDAADLPPQVRGWLEQGQPPVLISGGTSNMLRSGFYAASAAACQLLDVPALLVTQHRELLPETLPERVVWGRAFDFERIMPLMRAVIHHGGIGTLSQAMLAGVPQLVLAHGMDRPDNGARVRRVGCGDVLSFTKWQPDQIALALEAALAPGVRARCADLAQDLRSYDPLEAAVDAIEQAMGDAAARLDPAAFLADTRQPAPSGNGAASGRPQAASKLAGLSPEQLAALVRQVQRKR
ncbi:MAG TPA: nucleotide disphospho-sugar-binding domain-containing protein [Roseiflexaceae bacterium]|nr:nucleotide disphospho-sugar-binding domain-containing protein [Roseiflexaceae bacterium]